MAAWREPVAADKEQFPAHAVFEAGIRNHHISNTAYPIAHAVSWGPYKVKREHALEVVRKSFAPIQEMALYAHIPFCETRCSFCEYTVVGKEELNSTTEYMNALLRELDLYRDWIGSEKKRLLGFDIGGGTPSFVEAWQISELVSRVRESFEIAAGMEISIETTPKIAAARKDKMQAYRSAGIARMSMGIQVIQPDLLRILNRSENGLQHHFQAVSNIRDAGFEKFNLDLMYGFADQSLDSWRATLEHAIKLNPEYITLYRMRYKLTRISHQAPRVHLRGVQEQAELAKKLLRDSGYFANPGKNTFSRIEGDPGTSDYLTRRVINGIPYLGIGLGAQTMTDTTISYNDGSAGKNLTPYLRSIEREVPPIQDLYDLPLCQMAGKMCAVSFYFGEVDLPSFQAKYHRTLEDYFPAEVEYALSNGLMEYYGTKFRLTPHGARNFNGVIALFFAPAIKNYLLMRDPERAQDMDLNRTIAERVAVRQSA